MAKDLTMTTKPMATTVAVNPLAPNVVGAVEDTPLMTAGGLTAPGAGLHNIRWLPVQEHRTRGPAVGPRTRTPS